MTPRQDLFCATGRTLLWSLCFLRISKLRVPHALDARAQNAEHFAPLPIFIRCLLGTLDSTGNRHFGLYRHWHLTVDFDSFKAHAYESGDV
jgi:hypothetical protein